MMENGSNNADVGKTENNSQIMPLQAFALSTGALFLFIVRQLA